MSAPFTAIILAAGYSSRMGAFKPLLPLGESTVLERNVAMFRGAGIQDVRVVVGHRSEDLLPLLKRLQVRPLLNEQYQEGMFSSVVAAADSLDAEGGAFFLLPVDIPLIRRETIELLNESYRNTAKGILYPAFKGMRGHPPLISNAYRDRILSWNGNGGLGALLMKFDSDSETVETGDDGILLDMDTPEDYERLQYLLQKTRIPSRQDCEQLLFERFAPDSPVIEHCRAVARLALFLGRRLNSSGCCLDQAEIEAAALLHDLAKGEPDHAAAGAAILRSRGFGAVADPVAVHMDISPCCNDTIDAAQLLFLADKLVEGTRIVPLETRFRRQLERHAHDCHVLGKITRRLENVRAIQQFVEARLGLPLAELLMEFQA